MMVMVMAMLHGLQQFLEQLFEFGHFLPHPALAAVGSLLLGGAGLALLLFALVLFALRRLTLVLFALVLLTLGLVLLTGVGIVGLRGRGPFQQKEPEQ
jgi:hypothetical protein